MFSGASYHKQEVDGSRSLSIANLKGIENSQHRKLATQILITNIMGDGCVLTRAVMVRIMYIWISHEIGTLQKLQTTNCNNREGSVLL